MCSKWPMAVQRVQVLNIYLTLYYNIETFSPAYSSVYATNRSKIHLKFLKELSILSGKIVTKA